MPKISCHRWKLAIGAIMACASTLATAQVATMPSTPTQDRPTPRTLALYQRLTHQVHSKGAFFGQQFASWQGHEGRLPAFGSDIQAGLQALGTPSDHPALFGWNVETWLRGSPQLRMALQDRLMQTDQQGGINALHWPMANFLIECHPAPCTDNDNDPGIDPIALIATHARVKVPYSQHEFADATQLFDAQVDQLADFVKQLRTPDGQLLPLLVRPFHEMNHPSAGVEAHWWAGRDPAQFAWVFRRFVDGLRLRHGLNNLLFVYAPSGRHLFAPSEPDPTLAYARYWPEEDAPLSTHHRYVDVAAFDHYLKDEEPLSQFFDAIRVTYAFAQSPRRGVARVSAIAECGPKGGMGSAPFWSARLLPGLQAHQGELWRQFAYLMTWTNGSENFSTYPGAPQAVSDDFRDWFKDPATLFLEEVPAF